MSENFESRFRMTNGATRVLIEFDPDFINQFCAHTGITRGEFRQMAGNGRLYLVMELPQSKEVNKNE